MFRVAPIEHPFRGVLGAQNRHEIGFRAKRLTKRLRELVRRLEVGAQLEAQRLEKVNGEKVDVLPPVLPPVLRLDHSLTLCTCVEQQEYTRTAVVLTRIVYQDGASF
jgi:hypothetical protein